MKTNENERFKNLHAYNVLDHFWRTRQCKMKKSINMAYIYIYAGGTFSKKWENSQRCQKNEGFQKTKFYLHFLIVFLKIRKRYVFHYPGTHKKEGPQTYIYIYIYNHIQVFQGGMVCTRAQNVKKPLEGVPLLVLVQNASVKGAKSLCRLFER